jgi:hypothetical protein
LISELDSVSPCAATEDTVIPLNESDFVAEVLSLVATCSACTPEVISSRGDSVSFSVVPEVPVSVGIVEKRADPSSIFGCGKACNPFVKPLYEHSEHSVELPEFESEKQKVVFVNYLARSLGGKLQINNGTGLSHCSERK